MTVILYLFIFLHIVDTRTILTDIPSDKIQSRSDTQKDAAIISVANIIGM